MKEKKKQSQNHFLLLRSSQWFRNTIVYLTTYLQKDILIVPNFQLLQKSCYDEAYIGFWGAHKFLFLWDKCPAVPWMGRVIAACLIFFKNSPNYFPEQLYHFRIPPAMYERLCFSPSSPAFGIVTSTLGISCFNSFNLFLLNGQRC